MFSQSTVVKIALMIGLVLTASIFSNKFKLGDKTDEEYDLIRKYLLNDNPLYGFNKPKLWIHTKYEYNARVWKSFGSRSSQDLNQPYIHLTVKTIIQHCGKDFNICLIDDDSFQQLIPQWTTKLAEIPEPQRQFHRQLALLELLHMYGGFLVPNSFVCVKNLYPMYKETLEAKRPFILEQYGSKKFVQNGRIAAPCGRPSNFMPNTAFLGAIKRDPVIREMCEMLKKICNYNMIDLTFKDTISTWCVDKMTVLDGIYVGAKTSRGKPIVLEDLMQEKNLDVPDDLLYGVVVPADAILTRPKYQWFASLSEEKVLSNNCVVCRLMLRGILDDTRAPLEWGEPTTETVISI
jgi:hypothetical protein